MVIPSVIRDNDKSHRGELLGLKSSYIPVTTIKQLLKAITTYLLHQTRRGSTTKNFVGFMFAGSAHTDHRAASMPPQNAKSPTAMAGLSAKNVKQNFGGA
jgi:hypothetical protein